MEFTSCCSDKAWRLRLWTHDAESTRWLTTAFDATERSFPAAREVEHGIWLFENQTRAFQMLLAVGRGVE